MMTIIHLMGKINEQGKLEVELPEGLPPSTVEVTLEILGDKDPNAWENQPWTDEELEVLLKPNPKTGAEIAAWLMQEGETGWEHINMTGEEWVEEQRRKDRERSKW
jgi:hypothetical protein